VHSGAPREKAGGPDHYCVGRGQTGDICAEADAGHGSDSCGGSLVCREQSYGKSRCVKK
jgi:hypothetical protein